jgi:hypothetical protein
MFPFSLVNPLRVPEATAQKPSFVQLSGQATLDLYDRADRLLTSSRRLLK